jgi:hypothetical protein
MQQLLQEAPLTAPGLFEDEPQQPPSIERIPPTLRRQG